jgi:aminoacrylate hydrolase
MASPSVESIYQGVSQEEIKELVEFRQTYPYLSLQSNGITWRYQKRGQVGPTILFLAGGLQYGEGWFRHINHFKDRFRFLAPTFPDTVTRMSDVTDALVRLLTVEATDNAVVIGASLGGLIAQMLLRRCPERIHQVVLSNTSHPDPQWARRLQARLPIMQIMPVRLLRHLALRRLRQYSDPRKRKTKGFFDAYMIEHGIYYTTRDWIANHYRLIIDFCMNQHFTPYDMAGWRGKMLLIESEDDIFPQSTRQALRQLYPGAAIHRFGKGAGHSPAITGEAKYLRTLETFLLCPQKG